jgi:hypothetical protein
MKKYKLFTFFLGCLVFIFIFLRILKTGLLIFGLKHAKKIDYLNCYKFTENYFTGHRKLSGFRMEQFLTEEESKKITNEVYINKDLWEIRNPAMSTLGTASYLDGANKQMYIEKSQKSNIVMHKLFGNLHKKVINYFKKICPDSKIKFKKNAALPGFHIFECNSLFSLPVASVHKDLQWKRLTFEKDDEIDEKYTMSFTLALELPIKGGGLYMFESSDLGLLNYVNVGSFLHSFAKKEKIEYKVGYIVMHNGMDYHMIAPCETSKTHKRITLQGHGVYEKKSNTWWIYW